MIDTEDSAWVFDSLIGFLQGPIWSAPLLTFIEEKSLIFEEDIDDGEEYQKIYQEYKNLVDLLLGCFMDDIGITPEQFEHACTVNKDTKMPIQFQQTLFEQIWAANEYEIFKRMMIQKNVELQLQALNMIEQKYGLTPASLVYETEVLQDELAMEDLIHKNIAKKQNNKEVTIPTKTSFVDEHERLCVKYETEKALLKEAIKASTCPEHELNSSHETTEEYTKKSENVYKLKKLQPLAPISTTKEDNDNSNVKEDDLKKRQNYLKARRDELVALKKEARNQRFEMNTTRPSSARVIAEAAMKGNQELEISQTLEPSILQVRKALAARLKAEVVHK